MLTSLIEQGATWSPGTKLAVFFVAPAAVVAIALVVAATFALRVEYELSTRRRKLSDKPLPYIVGEMAEAVHGIARHLPRTLLIMSGFFVVFSLLDVLVFSNTTDPSMIELSTSVGELWNKIAAHGGL